MIDIISVLIGGGTTLLIWVILTRVFNKIEDRIILDDPTDDELQRTPYCPDCGSYDLSLQDNNDGVPWLKGHTTEIDYFQCLRCGRRFNDEDWESAKKFTDLGDSE
jgi:C4-type Zn-finger protein